MKRKDKQAEQRKTTGNRMSEIAKVLIGTLPEGYERELCSGILADIIAYDALHDKIEKDIALLSRSIGGDKNMKWVS